MLTSSSCHASKGPRSMLLACSALPTSSMRARWAASTAARDCKSVMASAHAARARSLCVCVCVHACSCECAHGCVGDCKPAASTRLLCVHMCLCVHLSVSVHLSWVLLAHIYCVCVCVQIGHRGVEGHLRKMEVNGALIILVTVRTQ